MIVPGAESLAHFRTNPVGFVREVIGAKPERWQAVALRALADPATSRLAIKSCHGPGKTALLAWAIIWWLCCFYPARVPCTAPSEHQLKDLLWPELHKWIHGSAMLRQILRWSSERVSVRACPETQFAVARVSQVKTTSAGPQAFGLQGFHDDFLLFVSDESSGVHDASYDAMEGAMSTAKGILKILAAGNPNVPDGWFYHAFGKNRGLWRNMTVGFNDSYRVSNDWARQMIRTYGLDSPFVRTRVLGQFPLGVEGGLIALAPVEAATTNARRREIAEQYKYPVRALGVDVAHTGSNDSVIAYANGRDCERLSRHKNKLSGQLARIVRREAIDYGATIVVVDASGGYGAAVCDKLQDPEEATCMPETIPVVRWHGSGGASNDRNYHNRRAEGTYELKLALENGSAAIPVDDHLIAQMTTIRMWLTDKNRIQIEKKDQFKRRIKRDSPDELDATVLALAPALLGLSGMPLTMSVATREALGLPAPDHRHKTAFGL